MSTATIDTYADSDAGDAIRYRAIHTGAVFALILGIFSVVMLLVANDAPQVWILVSLIPVIGTSVSLWSIGRIKRDSEQFTGLSLALTGFVLSVFFLVAGVGYGSYIYLTEVPDGYQRISFDTLRPTVVQERGGVKIPPEVEALDGKKIFIKGYIRPGSAPVRVGIDRFLMVRDNNQCCFGDLSKVKYFDQMAVQITNSHRIDDTLQILRMGGVLSIHPENLSRGPGYPVFSLRADYAVQ